MQPEIAWHPECQKQSVVGYKCQLLSRSRLRALPSIVRMLPVQVLSGRNIYGILHSLLASSRVRYQGTPWKDRGIIREALSQGVQ
ncbi:MAG: hypothetical protein CMN77_16590 [Spirochaetaceae bacterium]|nr:hypothetical protein [Spirochaetaceae bacterium]